jgi:hypothetical protein
MTAMRACWVHGILALLAASACWAGTDGPGAAPRTDPRVVEMLREVSPARLEADGRRLAGFGTRHTLSTRDDPARGIGAAERWVKEELERIAASADGRLRVEPDRFTVPAGGRLPRAVEVTNLVATLAGTEPGRFLVVGAHLDSRASSALDATGDAPGANDDASGVAAVLELARALAPRRLRATVVFLVTGGEEQGLLGARHWAEAARKVERNVEAMLNNDIIGNPLGANGIHDAERVRLFSEGVPSVESGPAARQRALAASENDSASRQLARAVADAQRRYLPAFSVRLVFRRDRLRRGGDHVAFNERGYAAVRFTEMNEDWRRQHQDVREQDGFQFGDRPEFVDWGYVANVTRVNLATLADLAWAPPPPTRVTPVSRLEAGTTLRWGRASDADGAGYEVLWRDTTAPDWEAARLVGHVAEVTLPLSKDDHLFSLRGVSRAGNRSLPVLALPGATRMEAAN